MRFLVFALVAFIIVMRFVGALFIIDLLLVLIFGVLETLFEGVLALWPMKV